MQSVSKRSFGDLKPENVMVVGKKNITLVDFSSSLDDTQGESASDAGIVIMTFMTCMSMEFADLDGCIHWQ